MEDNSNISSIDLLIGRYLSGNTTEPESQSLLKWVEDSEENRQYFLTCKILWLSAVSENSGKLENGWEQIQTKLRDRQNRESEINKIRTSARKQVVIVFRVAAAVLLLTGLTITLMFILKPGKNFTQAQSILEVPFGSQSSLTLPDGTKLWINSGSKLTYDNNYGKNNRNIYLTGEAYFDVYKNKKLPFVVHAGRLKIKALGTVFNVKAYPDEKKVETTLVNGLIEINEKGNKSPILLKPHQKITIVDKVSNQKDTLEQIDQSLPESNKKPVKPTRSDIILTDKIDIDKETSWKDGKLIFDREPLLSLTVKLSRRYDVHFAFTNEKLKEYQYTGTFNDLSLDQILEAMRFSSPIDFEIKEKEVILKIKNVPNY